MLNILPPPPRVVVALIMLLGLLVTCIGATETLYTVRKNDTLSTIARDHDTTTAELVRLNQLKSAHHIQINQKLLMPAKDISYTVKKGDALSTIARGHQVSTRVLIDYNNLSHPDRLAVGDVLLIPLRTKNGPLFRLDPEVERQLNRIRVKNRRWKHIVIHHSATKNGTVKGMDRYHREERRMKNGLAYHFVIGNGNGMGDGTVELGDRWKKQLNGGHLASEYLNTQSIGICLVGDFETGYPSKKQIASLHALCGYLTRRCNLGKTSIKTHTEINTKPTRCPGKLFPSKQFLADFRG